MLGAGYGSTNSPPSFSGLDSEFTVTYGDTLTGSFSITESDTDDVASLIASLTIGGDFAEDCGCLDMEASFAGESGLVEKSDLIAAVESNVVLSTISVDFTFTPSDDMIGKTYEVIIKVSDAFSSTEGTLSIVIEAPEVVEVKKVDSSSFALTEQSNQFAE